MVQSKSIEERRRDNLVGVILVVAYVVLRLVADPFFWRNISEFYSYAFEMGFVGIAWFIFRKQVNLLRNLTKVDGVALLVAIFSGFLVFRAAGWMHVPIPFDLSAALTIVMLLIVAPILEELIFRMALWQALGSFIEAGWIVLLATTVLFAAGHFAAYWFVPQQFQGFVMYQTFYVVLLGIAAGWRRLQSGSVVAAVIVHFGFNLGFFAAAKTLS